KKSIQKTRIKSLMEFIFAIQSIYLSMSPSISLSSSFSFSLFRNPSMLYLFSKTSINFYQLISNIIEKDSENRKIFLPSVQWYSVMIPFNLNLNYNLVLSQFFFILQIYFF
ncbi:hypothetical protein SSS_10743, partial [Sarcoptes scabiei]